MSARDNLKKRKTQNATQGQNLTQITQNAKRNNAKLGKKIFKLSIRHFSVKNWCITVNQRVLIDLVIHVSWMGNVLERDKGFRGIMKDIREFRRIKGFNEVVGDYRDYHVIWSDQGNLKRYHGFTEGCLVS